MSGQVLTAEQLAARWQVPKSQVYRLTREGAIPAVKLGRHSRYRLDAPSAGRSASSSRPADGEAGRSHLPVAPKTGDGHDWRERTVYRPRQVGSNRGRRYVPRTPDRTAGSCVCGHPTSPTYVRCLRCDMETLGVTAERIYERCGASLDGRLPDARYCSPACRRAAARKREPHPAPLAADPAQSLCLGTGCRAHGCDEALGRLEGRLAEHGPYLISADARFLARRIIRDALLRTVDG